MYTFLSAIDFSLCFLAVHAAGLERIEPYWDGAVRQYRVLRHGDEGADALEREDQRIKAEQKEQAKRDKEAGVTQKKDKEKGKANRFGSKALWAEIALAYAIHKTALLPIRAGITVAVTPKFVNWLAARGWVGKVSSLFPVGLFDTCTLKRCRIGGRGQAADGAGRHHQSSDPRSGQGPRRVRQGQR